MLFNDTIASSPPRTSIIQACVLRKLGCNRQCLRLVRWQLEIERSSFFTFSTGPHLCASTNSGPLQSCLFVAWFMNLLRIIIKSDRSKADFICPDISILRLHLILSNGTTLPYHFGGRNPNHHRKKLLCRPWILRHPQFWRRLPGSPASSSSRRLPCQAQRAAALATYISARTAPPILQCC